MRWRNARWAGLLTWAAGLMASAVVGQEPAVEFLTLLREKGYYDQALSYLDKAPQSSLFTNDFKRTLDYQRGLTLVAMSRSQRDAKLRGQRLDEAKAAFESFVAQNPSHDDALAARTELADVLMARGNMLIEQFKKSEDRGLLAEASAIFDQAHAAFKESENALRELIKATPVSGVDGQGLERRKKLQGEFVRTRVLGVAVLETKATETLAEGDAQRAKILAEAAAAYGDINKDYGRMLGGVYARIYQARCFQKLGKHQDAVSALQEILLETQDAMPEVRALALGMALESWIELKQYSEAALKALDWVDRARPAEAKEPSGLKIHHFGAIAVSRMAAELAKEKPRDLQVLKFRRQARQMANLVASQAGDYRDPARSFLASTGATADEDAQTPLPQTFAEAFAAGKEAFDAIRTSQLLKEMLPERIAEETDDVHRRTLQAQLEAADAQVAGKQADGLRLFQRALELMDADTSVDDYHTVLTYACYLYSLERDYYSAAVLGEFLGRRFPASPGARVCAKLAMDSYYNLLVQSKQGAEASEGSSVSADYFAKRTREMAAYIGDSWPGTSEADEALARLIPLLVSDGQLDQARAALARIPADSPKRGDAEVMVGQSLWSSYQEMRQAREAGQEELPENLIALKEAALAALASGVQSVRQHGPSPRLSAATLALAQLQIDADRPGEAIKLLEDPQIGPLTLLKNNDPAMAHPGHATQAYKTAIRGHMASLAADPQSLERARSLMEQLKLQMEPQELTRLYYGLAGDLRQQVEIASPQQRDQLVDGLLGFLQQMTSESNEFAMLAWAGNTLSELGGQLGGDPKAAASARRLQEGAEQAYSKLLELAKANPQILPSLDHGLAVRQRLAETRRRMGRYQESLDVYEEILKERNSLLPLQLAAAQTLQEWAAAAPPTLAVDLYDQAIKGTRLDRTQTPPRYTLWGWSGLTRKTAKRGDLRELFHEAQYNLAFSRNAQADQRSDANAKNEGWAAAKRDIELTARLYPDLGGDQWRGQYDELLKKIQRQLNEPVTGLQGLAVSPGSSTN